MPLPVFDSKDKIPEAVRDGYVEREGKWYPDVEDVTGIKTAQRKALDEKKQLEDRLEKALKGRKLEDVEKIIQEQETAEEKRQRESGKFDELLAKRIKELRDELDPLVAAGKEATAKLQKREFEDAVWEAAKKAGAIETDRKTLLKAAEGDYVTRDKSGKLVVVDKDGDVTSEDLEKLFTGRFKKDHAKLFTASGGSGGGAGGGGGGERKPASGKIAITDSAGILANLADVASGKAVVDMGAE